MRIAVRYLSLHGNTKTIAEEIADELGVEAISINDESELKEHVDVLFLGGAPYWSIMDPALEEYVKRLNPDMVGRVALFTTSNWSRRTAIGLRDILEKNQVTVMPGHFYAHMTQISQRKSAAREFARVAVKEAEKHSNGKVGLLPELKIEALTVGTFTVVVATLIAIIIYLLNKSEKT